MGDSPFNQAGQTVGTQINLPEPRPVHRVHWDLVRPPAAGAIEVRATGFCDVCRPEYFPDVRFGWLHISGRHPEWGPKLYGLEPVELADGRRLSKVCELVLMGDGYAMIVAAALNDQGKIRACPCGAGRIACELTLADWARVSFSGMRRG